MSGRYSVEGIDQYLAPCPFIHGEEPPSFHRCVEIPDEVVERERQSSAAFYSSQGEIREYARKQQPHDNAFRGILSVPHDYDGPMPNGFEIVREERPPSLWQRIKRWWTEQGDW